jgi:diguanylate cyclase (GGDEF)-like protein/PAS domain S-box-containing protein
MMRALIVDDREENRYYLSALLSAAGYAVDSAGDGAEALALAQQTPPDVIVADLLMPVMDGYTLLRRWKADARLRTAPFIVYSATYTEPENQRLALQFGADAFLLKGTEPQEFLDRLQQVLAHAAAHGTRVPQAGAAAEESALNAYGRAVIDKLEKKTAQLEQANRDLERDAAERARAEEALRLLNAAVLQSSEAILITDAELDLPGPRIVFVNAAFTRMTGYTPAEVLGNTPRMLQGAQTDRGVLQRLRQNLLAGENFVGEAVNYRKDGSPYIVDWRVTPIRAGDGSVTHYAATQRDVSESRRTLQRLTESEREQRQLREQLQDERNRLLLAQQVALVGSWETDLATFSVLWTEQTHRIHGTDPETFQPTHEKFLDIVHPDDRALVDATFQRSVRRGGADTIEHRLLLADGSIKVVEERWRVLNDADGRPWRAVGTCQDVSARKRLDAALIESQTRFHQLADNVRTVFFLAKPDYSEFLYVSPAFEAIWGRSRESLYASPQSWRAAITQARPQRTTDSDGAETLEFEITRPDGSRRSILARGFPVFDADGKLDRIAGLADDVTERKRAQAALVESEERFRQIADNIHAVFLLMDPDSSQIHYVSPAYAGIWGRSCASLYAQPRSWMDCIHADERDEVHDQILGRSAAGSAFTLEYRIDHPDGEVRWIRLRGFPVRNVDGDAWRTACIASDVTEAVLARDELRESNRRFNEMLDTVRLIAIMLDLDGRLTYCNDYFLEVTGCRRDEILGCSWFDRFALAEEREERKARYADLLSGDIAAQHLERQILTHDGERRWIHLNNTLLRSASGQLIGVASIGEDITEQRSARAELEHSLSHDRTTGLPRFAAIRDHVEASFVNAAACEGRVLLLYVDMDRFHALNDTRGRAVGDAVLRIVARRFQDAIGDNGRVSHVAGDEFAIVYSDAGRAHDQVEFGETLRSRIEEPIVYDDQQIYVACSIGVSCFPDNGSSTEELLRQAESALLQAKQEGRNAVVAFSNDSKQQLEDRLALGMRLNGALRNGEFILHYQPRINGQDWRVHGFEALLRWQSPEFGLLTPGRFLSVAEDVGLMVEIGRFVLESACRQARTWIDAGCDGFSISVNVSPAQLQRPGFVQEVAKALSDSNLPPSFIELELTESMIIGNIERVTGTLRALKAIGLKLSLDDFGTGYSSLNFLRKFPIDTLKIDQSFVRDISTDAGAAGVCRAIITLGHQLGMTVVAEGTETAAQVGYLRRNDCDLFQGYYFCKPVSAAQALELLRHRYLAHEGIAPASEQPTLLLVDDEENILNALVRMLRRDGYRILTATSADEALDVLGRNEVQVIISDQRMPGASGTELLRMVKGMYPDTVRMVLSGYTDLAAVTEAINQGAIYKFLTKPWNDEELRQQIRDAFRIARRTRGSDAPAPA